MRSLSYPLKISLALGISLFVLYVYVVGNYRLPTETELKRMETDDVIEPASGRKVDSLPTIALDHSACPIVWSNPYRKDSGWKEFYLSLRRYKKFHKNQLNCLKMEEAGKQNTSSVCKEPVRTLTWACTDVQKCKGIGDQFARIQLTLLLAMATNRVFTIYWNPKVKRTMQYLQPNEINWQFYNERLGMHTYRDMIEFESITSSQEFAIFLILLQSHTQHVTTTNELDVPFLKAYRNAMDSKKIQLALQPLGILDMLKPQLGKAPVPHLLGAILRYLFKFSSDVMEKVDHIQRSLGLRKPYLAVHLRTGFYGRHFEELQSNQSHSHGKYLKSKTSWKTLMECSIKSANNVLGPTSPIYLATDSYIVKQWAVGEYGSRVRVANMTLQHVAMEISWKDSSDDHSVDTATTNTAPLIPSKSSHIPDTHGYEGTWVDFILLARSFFLAHGTSGFSTAAGEFCSLPQKRQGCIPPVQAVNNNSTLD